jgi:hypothetical protein
MVARSAADLAESLAKRDAVALGRGFGVRFDHLRAATYTVEAGPCLVG